MGETKYGKIWFKPLNKYFAVKVAQNSPLIDKFLQINTTPNYKKIRQNFNSRYKITQRWTNVQGHHMKSCVSFLPRKIDLTAKIADGATVKFDNL